MYGRMLRRVRHAAVIFSVMMALMVGTIAWAVWFDTLQPNPAMTGLSVCSDLPDGKLGASGGKQDVTLPTVASLPVDQHLGNLEGKEIRFGTSSGATFAALLWM